MSKIRYIYAAYGESMSVAHINMSDAVSIINSQKSLEFDVEIITLPGPTRNGMLYPLEEMKKAVEDERIRDLLNRGALYGEGEHPLDPLDIPRWVNIPVDKRQFKWTKLWFDGNKMMGRVRTFPGNNNALAMSILNGELPAFSIRVLGAPEQKGAYRELHDIYLVTIDWVNYPGNPTSYVRDTDAFSTKDIPLVNEKHYADGRIVPRGESYNVLGLEENESLVSIGEGYYAILENFDKEKRKDLTRMRASAF